jgi:hypothetical protein
MAAALAVIFSGDFYALLAPPGMKKQHSPPDLGEPAATALQGTRHVVLLSAALGPKGVLG